MAEAAAAAARNEARWAALIRRLLQLFQLRRIWAGLGHYLQAFPVLALTVWSRGGLSGRSRFGLRA